MESVGALIFLALVGAVICAKAHSAGGAVLFGVIALVMFVNTPAGNGLPGAVADFLDAIDDAATPALTDDPPPEGPEAVG